MKLLLVRHGRTIANVMQALDTAFPGNPLDEVGLHQAEELRRRLESAGHLAQITNMAVSPILRARQTIAPIETATAITARIDSGLREVLAGDLEMNTDARSMNCYRDTTRSWMVGRMAARIPGSHEDGESTFARFNAAVERLVEATPADGCALLVAHGTVLRLWTALKAAPAAGLNPAWIAENVMTNTAISVVEGNLDHGWRLVDWNDGQWRDGQAAPA